MKDALNTDGVLTARFALPVSEDEIYLHRTHPFVEGLAAHLFESALDPKKTSIASRCGAMRTNAVEGRTTLLLLRLRYHIVTKQQGEESPLLAEECRMMAFAGAPERAQWLDDAAVERLLDAAPDMNISAEQVQRYLQAVCDQFDLLRPALNDAAQRYGQTLLEAHRRVRQVAQAKGVSYRVEPQLPPDVLGMYVFLPA
ncbi:helicase domain protein [Candidatus Moduliflexus flocculans]|uniref:Helicase domain protein n=1 Tax=Candidatus Moduliflexus flocculans TaxID=1499966 RepID=A0A081BNX1_9BACT|nr:helicase domain protein [Candidatus Moduliflexus flocculans]